MGILPVERDAADRSSGESSVQRVGSFRFFYRTDKWEWSDEVAALHGYAPGQIVPTTELLVLHKHPDDRARFEALVAQMRTLHAPFSSRHRIIDTAGRVHPVAVVGHTILDDAGEPIGTEGFYLDLAEIEGGTVRERVDEQVQQFRGNFGVIEQAKGMLMLVYGVSDERAFDVLKWRSQTGNIKIKTLCEAIVAQATLVLSIDEEARKTFDHLLLSVPG